MSVDNYFVGDEVDVWDGDIPGWVPGVVESIDTAVFGPLVIVATEEMYGRLPMKYGIPRARVATSMRPRLENER